MAMVSSSKANNLMLPRAQLFKGGLNKWHTWAERVPAEETGPLDPTAYIVVQDNRNSGAGWGVVGVFTVLAAAACVGIHHFAIAGRPPIGWLYGALAALALFIAGIWFSREAFAGRKVIIFEPTRLRTFHRPRRLHKPREIAIDQFDRAERRTNGMLSSAVAYDKEGRAMTLVSGEMRTDGVDWLVALVNAWGAKKGKRSEDD